jgi:hypothetical protein
MTPQEKAKELVDKFSVIGLQQRNEGIQCALIAVDEIYQYSCSIEGFDEINGIEFNPYWQKVKKEIEKL